MYNNTYKNSDGNSIILVSYGQLVNIQKLTIFNITYYNKDTLSNFAFINLFSVNNATISEILTYDLLLGSGLIGSLDQITYLNITDL